MKKTCDDDFFCIFHAHIKLGMYVSLCIYNFSRKGVINIDMKYRYEVSKYIKSFLSALVARLPSVTFKCDRILPFLSKIMSYDAHNV